jgi:hypothetical protein
MNKEREREREREKQKKKYKVNWEWLINEWESDWIFFSHVITIR